MFWVYPLVKAAFFGAADHDFAGVQQCSSCRDGSATSARLGPKNPIPNEGHAETRPRINNRFWVALIMARILGTDTGDFFVDPIRLGHLAGVPILAAILAAILIVLVPREGGQSCNGIVGRVYRQSDGIGFG